MTEDQLEQQCLEWFAEGGWEIAHGPNLAPDGPTPERADYRQVLLLADLEAAIRRINPHLPQSAIEQAVAVVRKPESLDVVISNRAFHRLLLDGVPVEYKRDDKLVHDQAFLVDFGDLTANRFRAI
ncbi:MAG: type I restriction endonuclease, partial [Halomonas sp.]